MSALAVRTYLENQAKSLGYKISSEAFTQNQLPANSGKLCFIQVSKVTPVKRDQASIEFSAAATARLFVGRSANQKDIQGKTIEEAEGFMIAAVRNAPSAPFAKLAITSYDVEPYSDQNDDVQVGVVEFEAGFVLGI